MDEKKSKHLQRILEKKTIRKQLGGGKIKPSVELEEPFLEKIVRKSVVLATTFWTKKISINQSIHFRYRAFTNSSLEIF